MAHRLLEVAGERLPGWVAGFADRHGPVTVTVEPDAVRFAAADGALARVDVPFGPAAPEPSAPEPNSGADPVPWLVDRADLARNALVLLLRRGGYALGVARDGVLVAHRCDTKYVQSRTAAGGWSQQRFARRRDGQAAYLVRATVTSAVEVLVSRLPGSAVLVVGGDRTLIEEVLTEPRLAGVAALPRTPVLDVKDPRRATLDEAVRRSRAIRIHLDEP